jgi:hypothetical protein
MPTNPDTKYRYRGLAMGIVGWIPLQKPVGPKCRIVLGMTTGTGKCAPDFGTPDVQDFGYIYKVQKNPFYKRTPEAKR